MDTTSDPQKVIKKIGMKTLGERDYAAQETSIIYYQHSKWNYTDLHLMTVIPVSLTDSCKVPYM